MQQAVVRTLTTPDLTPAHIDELRALLWAAFAEDGDGFSEDDWQHALGGLHFVAFVGEHVVAHAAVVKRELHVAGVPVRAGYVEAVATLPALQRHGHGTAVMRPASEHIRHNYELGALGTGSHGFYERLGWQRWRGPSFVRTPAGDQATPEDDGYLMVLTTAATPPLDLAAPISCEWRDGDVW